MDNASDALIMAGSVLLFIIALSVAVLSFSTAREAIDIRLTYADRDSSTIANDSNYFYLSKGANTNRYVGKETIIPALYRSYDENFKIVFEFPDDYYLFSQQVEKTNSSTGVKSIETIYVKKIDLSEQSLADDMTRRAFLDGIIYNKFSSASNKITNLREYEERFHITLNSESLYNKLSRLEESCKIKESVGVYYIDDLGNSSEDSAYAFVTDANKKEKRVITYTFER